jgi:hypothetical protein
MTVHQEDFYPTQAQRHMEALLAARTANHFGRLAAAADNNADRSNLMRTQEIWQRVSDVPSRPLHLVRRT